MNHQLFEDLLFIDRRSLTAQESLTIDEHLKECESCRRLLITWKDVEGVLENPAFAEPMPGFSSRFSQRWELEHKLHERRTGLFMLVASLSIAAILFLVLGLLIWPIFRNPSVLIWSYFYQYAEIATFIQELQVFIITLLRTTSKVIPFSVWILISGIICELIVIWLVSYRLLTNPRRVIQ